MAHNENIWGPEHQEIRSVPGLQGRNHQGLFSQIEYADDKFSAFFQGAVSNQSYQRTGRFDTDTNGNQVTTDSDKVSKTGFNVKGNLRGLQNLGGRMGPLHGTGLGMS